MIEQEDTFAVKLSDERFNFVRNRGRDLREAGEAVEDMTFYLKDSRPVTILAVRGFPDQAENPEEVRYRIGTLPASNPAHNSYRSYNRRALDMAVREIVGNGDDVESVLHAVSELDWGQACILQRTVG